MLLFSHASKAAGVWRIYSVGGTDGQERSLSRTKVIFGKSDDLQAYYEAGLLWTSSEHDPCQMTAIGKISLIIRLGIVSSILFVVVVVVGPLATAGQLATV